jgi:3-oxoisoapionate kinase
MTNNQSRDDKLLLSFYGDDVTGSTDVLEAAALAGVPAILFLAPPTAEQLQRYRGVRVVGVAGDSRSRTPAWMQANLPNVFQALKAVGAPVVHYKTCSTFDSSPDTGSIGRAIDIGIDGFGTPVPVVVGVVPHRRFVVFSTLFAAGHVGGTREVYRIDRHPTMSRHPITPMDEADLRLHLGKQTARPIAGFDQCQMSGDGFAARFAELDADIVILDTFDAATTRRCGELLAQLAAQRQIFVAGSSGVEYAYFDYLMAAGILPTPAVPRPCGPADKIIAVYGSCSPVSAKQIEWAENNGMTVIAADTVALVEDADAAEMACAKQMAAALSQSRGVVLCTARGPNDPSIARTRAALERTGHSAHDSSQLLGIRLGRVMKRAIERTGTRRAVLAGGDSSSHAIPQLDIEALEYAGPMVSGAPLCRAYAKNPRLDGLEIVLKGGQAGEPDFLGRLIAGH